MKINILTLFPEICRAPLSESIKKAGTFACQSLS
jgi:tRNA G37 N-methylase TrmD